MSSETAAPGGAEDVARALDRLRQVLANSADLVRAGRMVDLAGLDREVQQTLEAVVALPAPEARMLLPALDMLVEQLDAIAGELTSVHGAALPQQETPEARKRAAAAYRRTEET
ncbi:hypothetical protein [Indioceanicola profundi]|uniref:hypothetical protein n=1 Tax=Indioceanicola profundi TaxID=2220096 RepID=UPI000E6ADA74|nr:hypothetical protein [Indioceanicola profundi]